MATPMPAMRIVAILQQYGPVDVDFLAAKLGMTLATLSDYLESLEQVGVVRREGRYVLLTVGTPHKNGDAAASA